VVTPKINGFELADRILGMDSKLPIEYRELECFAARLIVSGL
jgi:hypothetical protein